MKTRITTNAEIKKILGLTGTTQDALVEIWNGIATEMLNDVFDVTELASHSITNERVRVHNELALTLRDFPVDIDQTITIKDTHGTEMTGITWKQDPNEKFTIRGYMSTDTDIPYAIGYKEVLLSYTAGYSVVDTLLVASISDLSGKKIISTIAGDQVTREFGTGGGDIAVGADANACAANIATALGGSAATATVTLPLGTRVELDTATTSQLTITNATIPEVFKMAIALIVGGGMAEKQKKGGVVSYRLGSKSINFRSEAEGATVDAIIKHWLPYYKRLGAVAI